MVSARLCDSSRRLGLFALFLALGFGLGIRGCAAILGLLGLALLRLERLTVLLDLRILGGLLGGVLRLLCRRGRHDAVVMFRMLKIIFGHDAIAAGIGVTRQLQVFLIDMAGRAANLDLRTGGIVGAIGIEAAAAIVAAAAATSAASTTMLRPAAASTRAFQCNPSLAE